MTKLQNLPTRERLLQTAIVEFSKKGLDDSNLRDICAHAEVNLNAVRYHFGGKEALYIAAVELAHKTIVGDIFGQKALQSTDETSPEDLLREIISGMLAVSMSDTRHATPEEMLMSREILSPTEATAHIAQSHVKPHFDFLNMVIARLLPEKTPKINHHMIAISVIGQCMHFKFGRHMDQLVISQSEYRKFTISRLTEHILLVTLAAIEKYSEIDEPKLKLM